MEDIETKKIMQNMIKTMESRLNQIHQIINSEPRSMELDHIFLNYAHELVSHIDTYEERFGK